MQTIKGRYYIADCEHNGDVERAVRYCTDLGCKVLGRYWDGHDCGDAYLDIEVSVDLFKKLYNQDPSFVFNADIRDYVDVASVTIDGYNNVSMTEFKSIKTNLYKKIGEDFADNIPNVRKYISRSGLSMDFYHFIHTDVSHYVYKLHAGDDWDFVAIVKKIDNKQPLRIGQKFYNYNEYVSDGEYVGRIDTIWNRDYQTI